MWKTKGIKRRGTVGGAQGEAKFDTEELRERGVM